MIGCQPGWHDLQRQAGGQCVSSRANPGMTQYQQFFKLQGHQRNRILWKSRDGDSVVPLLIYLPYPQEHGQAKDRTRTEGNRTSFIWCSSRLFTTSGVPIARPRVGIWLAVTVVDHTFKSNAGTHGSCFCMTRS